MRCASGVQRGLSASPPTDTFVSEPRVMSAVHNAVSVRVAIVTARRRPSGDRRSAGRYLSF
jgi:hypothetical protein